MPFGVEHKSQAQFNAYLLEPGHTFDAFWR